jgi:hypothetical protein
MAGDEDMADVVIAEGEAEEGIQSGPLQLVALDALVEEEIAVLGTALADHGLEVLGRAAEVDAEGSGLALRPAHIVPGPGFMLATGVARREEATAEAGPWRGRSSHD